MSRILLLMPSSTYHAPDFMAAALGLGVEVTVGTDHRQTLAKREGVVLLDFQHPDEAVRQVASFAETFPLDAVMGVDDDTAVLAAMSASALNLPTNPVEATRAARDKHVSRSRLAEAGLPTPEFHLLDVGDDPAEAARGVPFPCVLKPTFLAASRGVIRADDPDGFAAAFRRIAALLERPDVAARGGPDARKILVESFIPGPEVALEGLLQGGELRPLALWDKPDPLDGPFFAETLYVTPSRLPAADQKRILHEAGRAATALGLREGPVHAELRLGGPDPVIVEMAARTIGGLCSRALRFGTGMTLEEVVLRHALGRNVEPEREALAAGVLMLSAPSAGILYGVEGIEEALVIPGVERVDITIPVGQPVAPLPEGDRYLGFVFARAASPESVEEALRRAGSCLGIGIEPEDD